MKTYEDNKELMKNRSERTKKITIIFIIAITMRLIHLVFYKNSPYFIYPVVDAKVYLDNAIRILFGNWWKLDGVYYQAPLYEYFLAGTLAIGGLNNPIIIRLVQIFIGSLSAVIVFLIAEEIPEKITGNKIPLIAGIITAVNGTLIYFDEELLNPSLLIFLSYLSFYFLIRHKYNNNKYLFIAGLLAGLSAITGGGIILFIPILMIFTILKKQEKKKAKNIIIYFMIGFILPVSGVTLRNKLVSGETVLISSNAGLNFYIGNNPYYEKTVNTRPGTEWKKLANEPEQFGIKTHREYSRYYFKKSFRLIRDNPVKYIEVLIYKIKLLINGAEIPRNQEILPVRQYSPLMKYLLWTGKRHFAFPFGLIFPFAVYGMIYGRWMKSEKGQLLFIFTISLFLFPFIFFVTSRYRLQSVPGLIIFSAMGIDVFLRHLKIRKYSSFIILILILIFSNYDSGILAGGRSADTVYNIALSMEKDGKHQEAEQWFRKALDIDPEYYEAKMNLAVLLARNDKEYEKALELFRELEIKFPDNTAIQRNINECLRMIRKRNKNSSSIQQTPFRTNKVPEST